LILVQTNDMRMPKKFNYFNVFPVPASEAY
jgi:hypothetical protein